MSRYLMLFFMCFFFQMDFSYASSLSNINCSDSPQAFQRREGFQPEVPTGYKENFYESLSLFKLRVSEIEYNTNYARAAIHALSGDSFSVVKHSVDHLWNSLRARFLVGRAEPISLPNIKNPLFPSNSLVLKGENRRPECCEFMESEFQKSLFETEETDSSGFVLIYVEGVSRPIAVKKGSSYNKGGENTILALEDVIDPNSGRLSLIKGGVYYSPFFHKKYDSRIEDSNGMGQLHLKIKRTEDIDLRPARFIDPRSARFDWSVDYLFEDYNEFHSLNYFRDTWLRLLKELDAFSEMHRLP